jgi:hypothetical protein
VTSKAAIEVACEVTGSPDAKVTGMRAGAHHRGLPPRTPARWRQRSPICPEPPGSASWLSAPESYSGGPIAPKGYRNFWAGGNAIRSRAVEDSIARPGSSASGASGTLPADADVRPDTPNVRPNGS